MKGALIFILVFLCLQAQSQPHLDSLLSMWNDKSNSDSLRVSAFAEFIIQGVVFDNPDSGWTLGQKLKDYSKNSGSVRAKAEAHNIFGIVSSLRSDNEGAHQHFSQSLEAFEEARDSLKMAKLLYNISVVYGDQGNYVKSLDYQVQCLNLRAKIGDQRNIPTTLNAIGTTYLYQGMYLKALKFFERSLKSAEKIEDELVILHSLSNIGNIYWAQGNYEKALANYNSVLDEHRKSGDGYAIGVTLSNIGTVYRAMGDMNMALSYFMKSYQERKTLGNKYEECEGLHEIGVAHSSLGNYAEADKYLKRSKSLADSIGANATSSFASLGLGKNFLRQNFHQKAIIHCLESYEISIALGSLEYQMLACECLYDAYKALGSSTMALKYHELKVSLGDSMQVLETAQKLQRMEFAQELRQDSIAKAEEIQFIKKEYQEDILKNNHTKNIIAGISIIILIVAGGLYVRLRHTRKSKAELQTEKERSDNLLLNLFPEDIATELKETGKATDRDFEKVSVLFTDFKGFTEQSSKMSAQELVSEVNVCFQAFDGIVARYGIEKIKTIGDSYMVAGGLPVPTDDSVKNTLLAALEMQAFVVARYESRVAQGLPAFEMRIGVHTGPVVAGIVGVKKFQYDIWGDTVNTASRMESSGEVGKVNISHATYALLKDDTQFVFEARGKVEAKGKGEMEMWFVEKADHKKGLVS